MARDRTPPRRAGGRGGDYRRDRDGRKDDRDFRRDGHREERRDGRDGRNGRDGRDERGGRGDSHRDKGRLTPPRNSQELFPDRRGSHSSQEGRLSRPDDIPPPRRDRSNDRKRERSPDRRRDGGARYRSRERYRDGRGYRDDSRERKRFRRSDSVEDRRRSGRDRDDSRDRLPHKTRRELEEEAARAAEAEEKRAKEELHKKQLIRQARVAEWKKRHLAEEAAAAAAAAASRPVSAANDALSIASPVTTGLPSTPTDSAASPTDAEPSKPFVGKFDPKAIAKRAAMAKSKLENATLGDATSGPTTVSSTSNHKGLASSHSGVSLDLREAAITDIPGGALTSTKFASKAIAEGFVTTQSIPTGATESGPHIDMDEDAKKRRRLDKIPLADMQNGEATSPPAIEEDEGEFDAINEGTEEEQAAAARAAAERRAAVSAMEDVQRTGPAPDVTMDVEEEIDPLDAFMSELGAGPVRKSTNRTNRLLEPEVEFSDDEVVEAVGDEDERLAKAAKRKKKKDIPSVVHDTMKYEPFRKDFFTEPLELQDMTDADVKSLRFELDDIKVQGKNLPKPVQKFAQFGLGSHVLEVIRNLGFDKPTSIQAQAIPAIMSGRDVIGVARTGSGKTVAFLLPMFRHIKDQRPLDNLEGPIGIILAPTRELAIQIHNECRPYLKAMQLRAVCAYGGSPITEQIAALKRGAEIVVCTPGRLIDLLSANSGRVINLRRVTYVVMDEADRMFDMGFEPQITKILSNIRPDRQCVLFSATFPKKMEALARAELHEPVQITVGGRSTVPKEITQIVEVVPEDKKMGHLLKRIGDELMEESDKRVLIFVERQETADMLLVKLQRVGYPCVSVHGGREQHDRDDALNDFKAGNVPVMIATSVAARGLDVKQLTLVINYDVPSHMEDYVHRCGRTGRAGNHGTAVTFITPEQDRQTLDIIKALTQSETPVPEDVQKLADGFLAKIKAGTAQRFGSGFGGHGLDRLDAQHEAELKRQRLAMRREGKVEEAEDEDEEEKKEEKKDELPEIKVLAKGEAAPQPAASPAVATPNGLPEGILDGDIKVERYAKPEKPNLNVKGATKLDRAAAAAALINSRLGAGGAARAGASIDNRGPDAGEFHYKLEINDLPQKCRWAVTNRTNVAKILESTGVSITTKGRFYKAGEEPGVGDLPKMNVLVEGDTEVQVTTAVRELQRLIRDAQLEVDAAPARVGGRYTVV